MSPCCSVTAPGVVLSHTFGVARDTAGDDLRKP
jgi:hypothetical protein